MRLKTTVFALFAASMTLPTASLAQPTEAAPKVRFYELDPVEIEGGRARPKGLLFQSGRRPEFVPLADLKKDFLGKLKRTAAEASLR